LLLFAFEAARGFNGFSYPLLYDFLSPLRGLRVPSRFDLIINLSIGVLSAFGLSALFSRMAPRWRLALALAIVCGMTAEYASAPALAAVARPSLADRWLKTQPAGVIVEFPLPPRSAIWPSNEARYMYEGTTHFFPMLNGYSGFFPRSYLELIDVMETFPDRRSIEYLRSRNVSYVLLRAALYEPAEWQRLRGAIDRQPMLRLLAGFPPPGNEAIFVIR
jgi:hypothetical protein